MLLSLRIKAKVLMMTVYEALHHLASLTSWISSPTTLPSLTLFWSHRPYRCSSNRPGTLPSLPLLWLLPLPGCSSHKSLQQVTPAPSLLKSHLINEGFLFKSGSPHTHPQLSTCDPHLPKYLLCLSFIFHPSLSLIECKLCEGRNL